MIITNSRYALVGYFITSYPTRAHGIIVNYSTIFNDNRKDDLFDRIFPFGNYQSNKFMTLVNVK